MTTNDDLIDASAAAALLAELIPGRTAPGWSQWLANNRNTARAAGYRVPYERLGGRVFYRTTEVHAFADFERQRVLGTIKLTGRVAEVAQAFGLGKSGSDGTGRPFNLAQMTYQLDAHGDHFAQLVLTDPLTVYRLSPMTCAALYQQLSEVIDEMGQRAGFE